jgi:RimJ/RimL family protein N-acetyltransferase
MAPIIRYLYNDINSVNEIWNTLSKRDKFHLCCGNVPAVKDKFFCDPKGDFATKFIHDDFGIIITITIDNKPVGFFGCFRGWDESTQSYTDVAEVSFAVDPEYRGRGIATMLIKHAMTIIKRDSSYKTLEWYFTTDNKGSEALAKKFGFTYDSIKPNPRDKSTKLYEYVYKKK